MSFDWEIRKRICLTVLVNSGLSCANDSPLFTRTVWQILFWISQSNDKKGNPKNQDLDFLIEIHPEDGFLGGEIRFWISCSIGKSGFRFCKSKSGFPNRTHPKSTNMICHSDSIDTGSRLVKLAGRLTCNREVVG